MPLGTKVGCGPGYIVLHGYDGDPPPLPQKGRVQRWHSPPIVGPCLLQPNGRSSQLLLSTCWLLSRDSDVSKCNIQKSTAETAMLINRKTIHAREKTIECAYESAESSRLRQRTQYGALLIWPLLAAAVAAQLRGQTSKRTQGDCLITEETILCWLPRYPRQLLRGIMQLAMNVHVYDPSSHDSLQTAFAITSVENLEPGK